MCSVLRLLTLASGVVGTIYYAGVGKVGSMPSAFDVLIAFLAESGGEFGVYSATATPGTGLPGRFGVDYEFIHNATVDTFVGQGVNLFRVAFLLERICPIATGLGTTFNEVCYRLALFVISIDSHRPISTTFLKPLITSLARAPMVGFEVITLQSLIDCSRKPSWIHTTICDITILHSNRRLEASLVTLQTRKLRPLPSLEHSGGNWLGALQTTLMYAFSTWSFLICT